MSLSFAWPIAAVLLAGWLCLAGQVVAARRFARRPLPSATEQPPISVLKPLHGAEPGLYENLRSFLNQDYPALQIVLGVNHPEDLALDPARALIRDFPEAEIALVVDRHIRGSNQKVSNLENMLPAAHHQILVLADSDMRVDRRYLAAVTAPLGERGIGVVTCLYKAASTGGVWSDLGALHINFGFLPNALLADALDVGGGCFGATIALSRATLGRIGGFAPLRDELADDRRIGDAVRAQGLAVAAVALSRRRPGARAVLDRAVAPRTALGAHDAPAFPGRFCRIGRNPSAGDRVSRRRRQRIALDPLYPLWVHLLCCDGRRRGRSRGSSACGPSGSGCLPLRDRLVLRGVCRQLLWAEGRLARLALPRRTERPDDVVDGDRAA